MSRYAKPNVTIEELKQKIEDAGGIYEILEYNPSQQILKDMQKIEFSCENVTDDEDEPFDMPGFECGYDILPNGVAVDWVGAGGDWEDPIALCIYLGHNDKLRVYIPKDGNAYNFKLKSAIGNYDSWGDEELKKFKLKYEFDMNKLRTDASQRIIVKS